MLARCSCYLANELNLDRDGEETVHYGLIVISNFLIATTIIALAGYLAGALWATLFVVFVSGSLKMVAGGAHASTFGRCLIVTVGITVAAGRLAAGYGPVAADWALPALLLAGGASIYQVWRRAPAEPPNKPLYSPEHRLAMRRASFAVLAVLLVMILALGTLGLQSGDPAFLTLFSAGVLGLALHALTLSHPGHRLAAALVGGGSNLPIPGERR